MAERLVNPTGDCIADEGSDWMKDAGDEGGAMNGSVMAVEDAEFTVAGAVVPGGAGSGTRTA